MLSRCTRKDLRFARVSVGLPKEEPIGTSIDDIKGTFDDIIEKYLNND